jgi:putative hydrolase of HD superfamily
MQINEQRLRSQFEFLVTLDAMKSIERRSPVYSGGRRENDAEHSWHTAVMAMVFAEYAPEGADPGRAAQMLLVHDLIEIYAGDTFAYDVQANAGKAAREAQAADRLYALLPPEQGAALRGLWEEFDAMETPDARYAAALDRVQPILANWLCDGHTWREGKVHAPQVYERMDPVRTGAPGLWPAVVYIIEESIKRGILQR